jgi:hypothetical protein
MLSHRHVSALAECVRIAPDPATESATQHDGRLPDRRPGTDEVWRRRGFADVAVPCGIRPASVGWPGRPGPGEATGLGQFSGLLSAVDGLVYAVSCGAGRWLVRDETKDQRFRLRLASGP